MTFTVLLLDLRAGRTMENPKPSITALTAVNLLVRLSKSLNVVGRDERERCDWQSL